jgi:hypothetical protein
MLSYLSLVDDYLSGAIGKFATIVCGNIRRLEDPTGKMQSSSNQVTN